jgi:hypothetical protein
MSTTELIRVEPLLPMDPAVARAAMTKYRELTAAMLTDEDWQVIPNGRFVKRSGFQKIASGYGVSTEIVAEHVERNADGQPVRASATVRATHPSGRYADGSGRCSIDESRFAKPSGRAKAEHDVAATAVTRATNRAISNLVGFGQVSAEEIDGAGPTVAAGLPYGPEGSSDDDDDVAAIVQRLHPDVDGALFMQLVNSQFGTGHVPIAAARMVHAIEWAAVSDGGNRVRKEPENAPPPAEQSAYHAEATEATS